MVDYRSFDKDLDAQQLAGQFAVQANYLWRLCHIHSYFLRLLDDFEDDPSDKALRNLYDAHYALALNHAFELPLPTSSRDEVMPTVTAQQALVDEFRIKARQAGRKVSYQHIFKMAGYKDGSQFRLFRKNKLSPGSTPSRNFMKVLKYDNAQIAEALHRLEWSGSV